MAPTGYHYNYHERRNINKAKLDNGDIVKFKLQSISEERGRECLKHRDDSIYLGEGIHYSHNGARLNTKRKMHFFTWPPRN
jgi:hypothetical protein